MTTPVVPPVVPPIALPNITATSNPNGNVALQPQTICLRPLPRRQTLPRITPATELMAKPLPLPAPIIAGVLHSKTKGILAAGSKVGKSWILLDLAFSVASGTRFLNWDTRQGRVLYINLEIDEAFLKERFQGIQAYKNLPTPQNLVVWNLRGENIDLNEIRLSVLEELHQPNQHRFDLIIIDPIYKLLAGKSENSAATISKLGLQLDAIIRDTQAAVIFAQHYSKGNQAKKRALDRISGSGVFARDADTVINLTEHRQEACYVIETTLRNMAPSDPFVVEWVFPAMVLRPRMNVRDIRDENPPLTNVDLESVFRLLFPGPIDEGDWRERAIDMGISQANFITIRNILQLENRIFQNQDRSWSCFQAPEIARPPTPPPVNAAPAVRELDLSDAL